MYTDNFDHAKSNIKQNSILMKRQLNKYQLMESLRFASLMLQELRNPNWSPKQYYELYILVFDSLSILSDYLIDNHPKKHHLADLYELVQYSGNVLPRLYLMVTVGTCYLNFEDTLTKQEILKDLIEMARGVQNPIRGLFLRYFISQRTKQYLLEKVNDTLEVTKFNCQFILNNFIEMNKLWVRLQYQGPLRDRDQRTKERKELQILVGSQLVRLSQIIEDDNDKSFETYSKCILPVLLEQVNQCKDTIGQEYLFDIICRVFPDHYHFKTLKQLLNTTIYLNSDVDINRLIILLINRLKDYVNREIVNMDPSNDDIFQIFWQYINDIQSKNNDFSLNQLVLLIQNIIHLSLTWYKDNLVHIENLFQFLFGVFEKQTLSNDAIEFIDPLIFQLLTFTKDLENNDNDDVNNMIIPIVSNSSFYYEIIINCPSYTKLLLYLNTNKKLQISIISTIIDQFLKDDLSSTQSVKTSNTQDNSGSWVIHTRNEIEILLTFLQPLIEYYHRDDDDSENSSSNRQELISKLCHTIFNNIIKNKKVTSFKTIEDQLEAVIIIKNYLNSSSSGDNSYHGTTNQKNNSNILITYPSIIAIFWKLIRMSNFYKSKIIEKRDYYDNLIKQIFKYISRCNNDLYDIVTFNEDVNDKINNIETNMRVVDYIFKLNVTNANLADQLGYTELAYDFFSQAFTIFEESISDSKTQFQALNYMTQSLQRTRSLYDENKEEIQGDNYYNSLIVRCTLHGSKLLKKQDQCRSVYLCSHLWWATEINSIGEEEAIDESKSSQLFYHNGKRLLECLQRSLRTADSIMDNVQCCELMVEILNRCLYYFARGEEFETMITSSYVNGLIELIKSNLKSLNLEETTNNLSLDESNNKYNDDRSGIIENFEHVAGLDGQYWKSPSNNVSPAVICQAQLVKGKLSIHDMIRIPTEHFKRTCNYIVKQRSVDSRFNTIIV
ncbi:retromer subunit VPS35 PWA37_004450 [Arxiozyma heterogenica]|uniref:retromer subunit VPS35 n=1 Tax=Arxiozyma heterogenica TaxID=278026 RepID=UPI002EFFE34D